MSRVLREKKSELDSEKKRALEFLSPSSTLSLEFLQILIFGSFFFFVESPFYRSPINGRSERPAGALREDAAGRRLAHGIGVDILSPLCVRGHLWPRKAFDRRCSSFFFVFVVDRLDLDLFDRFLLLLRFRLFLFRLPDRQDLHRAQALPLPPQPGLRRRRRCAALQCVRPLVRPLDGAQGGRRRWKRRDRQRRRGRREQQQQQL